MAGVDGPWLGQQVGIVVLIKTRPAGVLLSQTFVINISGAKFENHCFNNSRDILYSVFYDFSCKP